MTIKKLKPTQPSETINTFDIETDKDGNLLDIGFAHDLGYETFGSWDSMFFWLNNHAAEYRIKTVWAHNGGNFDAVAMCMWLRSEKGRASGLGMPKLTVGGGGRIMKLEVSLSMNGGEKWRIKFQDSFLLLPMSLEKALKSFGLQGKASMPEWAYSDMGTWKEMGPEKYAEYLRQDCRGLKLLLERYRDYINRIAPIGDLAISIASTAMRVFKTGFMPIDQIITPGNYETLPTRLAYSGGRTEYFRPGLSDNNGELRGCHYYDVNSMYPSIMRDGIFPISPGTRTKKVARDSAGIPTCGVYEVQWQQTGGRIPLLRATDENGKKTRDFVWWGQTWLTHIELDYLEKIGADIQILDGYVYDDCLPLFKNFIDTLYGVRMQARADGNTAMDLVAKLLMNNLYGKFGQRDENQEVCFMNEGQIAELKKRGVDYEPLSLAPDSEGFYPVTYTLERKCPNAFPAIAAFITAQGRVNITRAAEKYFDGLLYCDTDSLVLQGHMEDSDVDASKLGAFKVEHENAVMVFWGRKGYAIKRGVDSYDIKQKGLPKSTLDASFVREMVENGNAMRTFKSPTKILTALRTGNENPSKFLQRHRLITADLSSEEKGLFQKPTGKVRHRAISSKNKGDFICTNASDTLYSVSNGKQK